MSGRKNSLKQRVNECKAGLRNCARAVVGRAPLHQAMSRVRETLVEMRSGTTALQDLYRAFGPNPG
eukprot:3431970-Amphidinium_carterae.1